MAKDEMTPVRCQVVLALADTGMRAAAAGRKLHLDHSCVLYHMKLIKAITGLDPKDFYDLGKLVQMAKKSLSLP